MTKYSNLKRRPLQSNGQRKRAVNACALCGRPITEALAKMLDEKVPGDIRCRTHAELIAEVLISKAVKGGLQAIREIVDRVEGKPSEAQNHELNKPVELRVVYADPIPGIQNRDIDSAQPRRKSTDAT